MQIIPFDPNHLNDMDINWLSPMISTMFITQANLMAYVGPCFSGLHEGRIVGCAGLIQLWPGVAQAWVVLDKKYPKLAVYRAIKRALETLIKVCNYHRVQANTPIEFEAGHVMLKGLGFRPEAPMKEYGPDKSDVMQYVRLESWKH